MSDNWRFDRRSHSPSRGWMRSRSPTSEEKSQRPEQEGSRWQPELPPLAPVELDPWAHYSSTVPLFKPPCGKTGPLSIDIRGSHSGRTQTFVPHSWDGRSNPSPRPDRGSKSRRAADDHLMACTTYYREERRLARELYRRTRELDAAPPLPGDHERSCNEYRESWREERRYTSPSTMTAWMAAGRPPASPAPSPPPRIRGG